MAYPIASQSILELTFEGIHEDQKVMNVLHYRYEDAAVIADGAGVADAFLARINAAGQLYSLWRACMSVNLTNIVTSAQWITPLRYRLRFQIPGLDSGAIAGDAYPTNTAIAITKLGERATRHDLSTLHMPAVPLSFVTNSLLQAAGAGSYTDFATAAIADMVLPVGGQLFVPVIFNRAAPATSARWASAQLQNFARTMRRRTVGVGE